eukprot:TRINITY_DN17060_c0_g1_i1.p1 TRINITY_DN17060_c0_g1~~TRINITY_DN17060_c0_g1_i1.p1  ORF type:complete len:188 (-),score=55.92 TRINITY_DN17060_c0_g1_i1:8-571(-)
MCIRDRLKINEENRVVGKYGAVVSEANTPEKIFMPISGTNEKAAGPKYSADGLKNAWHFAVRKPLKELMELLLSMQISIDEGDLKGRTPFMEFLVTDNRTPFMGYQETFDFLKSHGISVNKAKLNGTTPLILMAKKGRFHRVLQLLSEGADVNACNRKGNSALKLSLIHICRCRRIERCRSRWSPYH